MQDETIYIPAADDRDYAECIEYLMLIMPSNNEDRLTQEQIAQQLNIAPRTLRHKRKKWAQTGIMARARREILAASGITDDIRAVNTEVLQQWPEVVRRQLETAIRGRSDKNALEAAKWLEEAFIRPELEDQEQDAGLELSYIQTIQAQNSPFDPLSLDESIEKD